MRSVQQPEGGKSREQRVVLLFVEVESLVRRLNAYCVLQNYLRKKKRNSRIFVNRSNKFFKNS